MKVMRKLKSLKFWWWLTLIALLVSLIPMIWISFYTHIVADDYLGAVATHQAWIQTHNPLLVLKEAFQSAVYFYLTWQGPYVSNFLSALLPALWGEQFYFMTTIIILGVFLICNAYFFRKMLRDALQVKEKWLAGILSNIVAILCIQLAVCPSQAFFWWNGAEYYIIFYALMLPLIANVLTTLRQNHCGTGRLIGMIVLALCMGGGNLITGLVTTELLILTLLYAVFKKKIIIWQLGVVLAVFAAGFALNIYAPGTLGRLATRGEKLSILQTVWKSYLSGITYAVEWTSPMLIIGVLMLTPFLCLIPEEKLPATKVPLIVLLLIEFSVFASTFAPTIYVVYKDVGRVQNVRLFIWILTLITAELTLMQSVRALMRSALGTSDIGGITRIFFERYASAYFLSLIAAAAVFLGYYVATDYTNVFTSTSCLRSLLKGEAQQYHEVMLKRTAILQSDQKTVVLPWLGVYPDVLYISDFQPEPDGWTNIGAAQYYHKDQVRME